MQQLGRQLGIPLSLLPPHVAPDTVRRDEALALLLKEGLRPSMSRAADEIDAFSQMLDANSASRRLVALQPPADCLVCGSASNWEEIAAVICAAAAVVCIVVPAGCPAASAGCAAAGATFVTLWVVCQIARGTGLC